MLKAERTSQFKRDLKLVKKRSKNLVLLQRVMKQIQNEKSLSSHLKDHPLIGNWKTHRELHIEPDWLLIYKLISEENTVVFVRTGSHSDLFK